MDVRSRAEHEAGAVDGAVVIPLAELRARAGEIDLARPIVVYCAGGYRSSIAASWLRRAGAGDVSDLVGGFTAWADLPVH
jgi:rhodanese-related sulfurtransferase